MERLTYRGSETMTEEDGWIRPSPEEGTVYSCYSTRKIIERLAEYEDLEEQGLLLRLPCKVGDTVYSIANDGKIYPVKATREVRIVDGVLHIICEICKYSDLVSYDDIGKTVFLTKSEAEQKLKEMESD